MPATRRDSPKQRRCWFRRSPPSVGDTHETCHEVSNSVTAPCTHARPRAFRFTARRETSSVPTARRTNQMSDDVKYEEGVFCWVDLMAHDMEAAKRFYSQLFGWEMTPTDPQMGYTNAMQ